MNFGNKLNIFYVLSSALLHKEVFFQGGCFPGDFPNFTLHFYFIFLSYLF